MEFQELILLILVVMNTLLGVLVVASNRRDPVNVSFAGYAGSLALWTFALIIFRSASSEEVTLLFLKFAYIAALSAASALYFFTRYFPEPVKFSKTEKWFHVISGFVIIAILLLPGVLVTRIDYVVNVRMGVLEPFGYGIFSIWFVSYYFGSLVTLYRQWRHSTGLIHTQTTYALWSILVLGLLGSFFNLVLPSPFIEEWRFTWVGPIWTTIMIGAISYAITRHHLLNIRVIAAEILTVSIAFLLFAQTVLANTAQEFALRLFFFGLVTLFGAFLIRSVRNEVKQKEELAKLTVELEGANEQLKVLDEAKSEFVSIASHQLRTPLTVIKGYISMLTEGSFGKIPAEQAKPLEKIQASSNRLIDLVENLLSVSRIESGRMKYNLEDTPFEDLVASVYEELATAAKQKKLRLVFHRLKKPLPAVSIDREKIRQVIMNLVDNAVKYTKKGVVTISLRFEPGSPAGRIKEPSVVFSVTDTGAGVSKEEQGRLFQKFIRGQTGALTHTQGTGLGLYVGRMMVEAHHGIIWVESEGEGKGSTFAFALPVSKKQRPTITLRDPLK